MAAGEISESDARYILAVGSHPDPVVTTTEIAEEIGVTQQAVHSKFSAFEERGLMESKKTGSRSKVWWLTTNGRRAYSDVKQ
jgi:DNA-binding MarR family transcriptional regulator